MKHPGPIRIDADLPANPIMLLAASGDMYKAALAMATFAPPDHATIPVSYVAFCDLMEAVSLAQRDSWPAAQAGKPSMGEPADQCAPPPQPPPPTWWQLYAQRSALVALEALCEKMRNLEVSVINASGHLRTTVPAELALETNRQRAIYREMQAAYDAQEKRNASEA
jgi:hypothetical protein